MTSEKTFANSTEELDAMLCKLDIDECVKFFAGMSEKDRKVFAERAMQWYEINLANSEISTFWGGVVEWTEGLPKRTREQLALLKQVERGEIKISSKVKDRQASAISRLALTACAGLSDLRKIPFPNTLHAFEIMRDRKPKHLDRWLDFACSQTPYDSWELARSFERDGICQAERGDGYWLAMALSLGQKTTDELAAYLNSESELLGEMVWKMLESDGAIRALSDPSGINEQVQDRRRIGVDADWRNWGHRIEASRRASYLWRVVLAELAQKNSDYQEKLLDIVFSWLARLSSDIESKATGGMAGELSPAAWFQGLHDEMNLSAELKSRNAGRYVGLLSLKDSSTLGWAIQNLQSCVSKSMPVDDLLASLPRVFYHKRKDPAIAAIKLLETLEKNDLLSRQEAANIAVEGLEHSSVEVQKKVMSYLKKSKMLESPETIAALESRVESLSGLVKKEVHEVVSKHSALSAAEAGNETYDGRCEAGDPEAELQDLKERINALDLRFAELAEISAVLSCLDTDSSLPTCAKLEALDIPRLDPSKKIAPLTHIDDLIFLFLHALEAPVSADDIERLLDGLMRLNHIHPDDFDSRVSSLRNKLAPSEERIRTMPSTWSSFNGVSQIMDLQSLGIAWLKTHRKEEGAGLVKQMLQAIGIQDNPLPVFFESAMNVVSNSVPPLSFFSERNKAMQRFVSKRIPLPLLAAPTHMGGWIDPLVIAERLAAWEKRQMKPDKVDVIQMFLRLAPEHRSEALAKIPSGNDEYLRAIRYALGGEMKTPVDTPELWVAAFRCREPRGSSSILKERFPDLGPDSAVAAEYVEKMDSYRTRHDGIYGTSWTGGVELTPIEINPAVKFRSNLKFFPIELLHDRRIFWDTGNDLLECYFLPNREPYLAYLARRIAIHLDSQGDYWKNSWASLFDPDISLNEMGIWVLLFGLSCKSTGLARLALDALIAAIEEDRIDGRIFGERMAGAYSTEKITLSRWITALREVFRIAPLHLHFVQASCEACLAELPHTRAAKPPIPILELLYDACLSSNYAIRNLKARNFLEKVEGKGKGAKLAKLLLELSPNNESIHRKKAAIQMLEARTQRAERWQSWR